MLTLENVQKKYGDFHALQGIDLEIPDGSVFALPGPNGSGKTTLLKILLGLVAPEKGAEIRLNGKEIHSESCRRSIVYMPQIPAFLPHLKVRELVGLVQGIRQQQPIRADEIIQDLGIGTFWNRRLGDLSGGMRQKVNILQALMFDFELAVLDEPTASLDPGIAYYLKALIHKLAGSGRTVLFTSHIMAEVEELAMHMALLVNGRVHVVDSPREFIQKSGADSLEQAVLEYWKDSYAN